MASESAVRGAYVKVYAKCRTQTRNYNPTLVINNWVMLWKDGYTDMFGQFDYASVSNGMSLKDVERFSVLVCSDEFGAQVSEVRSP